VYLIIPPYFESVEIRSPITNKTARIRVENFDPSYQAIYIQNATLNGKDYTRNWIGHEFFTDGLELVVNVGRNESNWGTRIQDLPPSLNPYSGFNSSNIGRTASDGASSQSTRPTWKDRKIRYENEIEIPRQQHYWGTGVGLM
jgi:hypothetical protein